MEEMIVLPKKELPEIVQWYKGELTSNALLNRAGHLAAKKKRLLADPSLDAAQAVQQTQTAVACATRGHQTSATTSRSRRARRGRGRGRRGREFGQHGVGKMDETHGAIRTQTRTQDATPGTHNTTRTPSTDHCTPGPQTSGRLRPGQEDHHHPEGRAVGQEKEKEFYCAACWKRVCWQVIRVWIPHLKRGDVSIQPRDGKIGPKGENCVVHWPETIIEKEEEETGWLWVGYPKNGSARAGANGIGPAISTWDPARI